MHSYWNHYKIMEQVLLSNVSTLDPEIFNDFFIYIYIYIKINVV